MLYKRQSKMSRYSIAILAEELKIWTEEDANSFKAYPVELSEGSLNLLNWECSIPKTDKTPCLEFYKLNLVFNRDYPLTPPKCKFQSPIVNGKMCPSGELDLPCLEKMRQVQLKFTIKNVLLELQEFLNNPDSQFPTPKLSQVGISVLQEQKEMWKVWLYNKVDNFYAYPVKNPDESYNLAYWECCIPANGETPFQQTYNLKMIFNEDFPISPPKCLLVNLDFHPHVSPLGEFYLSLLDKKKDWQPTISIRQILIGISNFIVNSAVTVPIIPVAYLTYKQQLSQTAAERLSEEYVVWRRPRLDRFMARPLINIDGTLNLMIWECSIPGKSGTPWAAGYYKLHMLFKEDFPISPPKCIFDKPLFHPNIHTSGEFDLPLLNEKKDWTPTITIENIVLRIQDFLAQPDDSFSAQSEAYITYFQRPALYKKRVCVQAMLMTRF